MTRAATEKVRYDIDDTSLPLSSQHMRTLYVLFGRKQL